ncbi:MAG: hypothetical protein AVO33_10025 [delta proteobacterium ML8_F1]|nr:MAG: hypothetical protein AVO33_10025 [delta proteobacterium ML8_F1]
MKRFRSSGWLLVIVALILSGCSGEKPMEVPETTGAPEVPAVEEEAAVPEESPLEQLDAARDKADEITSMRQLITVNMAYEFDESAFSSDDTGMAGAMMGMMSDISTVYDLRLEGINFEDPGTSDNLKGEGKMTVNFGEESQELEIYISDNRVYTDIPELGLTYSVMEEGAGVLSYDQISLDTYLPEDYDEEDFDISRVTVTVEGQPLALLRFTYKDGAGKILDTMESYSDVGAMVGESQEDPSEFFEFSAVDYGFYLDENQYVVGTEMTLQMKPKDPESMMGIKSMDYEMTMWILDINATQVTLPDLSGAQEDMGIY